MTAGEFEAIVDRLRMEFAGMAVARWAAEDEAARLKSLNEGLAARIAAQSELLGRRAERAGAAPDIVEAGVGPGHPRDHCSRCGLALAEGEGAATCSEEEYLTLCRRCYEAAGNAVR